MKNNDWRLDGEFNPNKKDLENLGMTDEEGSRDRAYPGQYLRANRYDEPGRLFLRTFGFRERPPLLANGELETVVVNDVGNQTRASENQNVRFWIGTTGGKDRIPLSMSNTVMEPPFWASRFRVFIASTGTQSLCAGTTRTRLPPSGSTYSATTRTRVARSCGHIHFQSATYLFGSLIAWMGGCRGRMHRREATARTGAIQPTRPGNAVDWRGLE